MWDLVDLPRDLDFIQVGHEGHLECDMMRVGPVLFRSLKGSHHRKLEDGFPGKQESETWLASWLGSLKTLPGYLGVFFVYLFYGGHGLGFRIGVCECACLCVRGIWCVGCGVLGVVNLRGSLQMTCS